MPTKHAYLSFREFMNTKEKAEIVVSVDPRLEEIIPKFIASQKVQRELICVALKNLNYGALELLGHRMKGSCGGYGFFALGELGQEIERAAKRQDQKLLHECLARLDDTLARLRIEFKKR